MKKGIIIVFAVFLICFGNIYAMNLDVSVKPISDTYIIDLNKPASFELIIKNLGDSDEFQIYSLVGIDLIPETSFKINKDEAKTIKIEAIPQEALISKRGFLTFEYLIKDSKDNIQKGTLSINIAGLEDAISITPNNIDTKSDKMDVTIKNTIMYDFDSIELELDSAFFKYKETFPLKALETKLITISLNKEKLKSLDAGAYLIDARIKTSGKIAQKEVMFKFLEEENIETTENLEGILIRRREVIKDNVGNVKKFVTITNEKNLFEYLFTTVNTPSTKTEIKGFKKYYTWEKELVPGEKLRVIIKTNWLYPILIILLIIGLFFLIRRYLQTDLTLKKKVSFVKTKGGEFALKVQIRIRARRFIEKIRIIDRAPALVKLYDKFGAIAPNHVSFENKMLEWDIESLNPREDRVFSYIIYSKIGIVGRFELPPAKAFYEREGEMKDALSNKAFFINEPSSRKL